MKGSRFHQEQIIHCPGSSDLQTGTVGDEVFLADSQAAVAMTEDRAGLVRDRPFGERGTSRVI